MDEISLLELLKSVKTGEVSVEDALKKLKSLPYVDLGFAKVDSHRQLRQGFPEVIFCPGKTTDQIVTIFHDLYQKSEGNLLATRASREVYEAVSAIAPEAQYNELARLIMLRRGEQEKRGHILVVSAGTADLPVAEEAALTAEVMGNYVERLYDTGVAGIHRLLSRLDKLQAARVLIVVAGMEGALASVVGGLVDKPVIAVPTSIGYGASFGGLAALLAMLNSCASGVGVVNIDNGFGAGYLANNINRLGEEQ
ncbi:MAG: nickel pincer cofactor biosynthesis protein LarB [Desulfitobacteriia bacterium]|jgi:NCAIR mutase (PurE)-related protein